jgi:branched-chain amino acid aminotransferase
MTETASGRTELIWRDGRLVPWTDATIHVMSHVVHYGSSVFEGVRCYQTSEGGAIFRLREHMRRLIDSARIYRMPLEHDVDTLMRACVDTVAANGLEQCYLRPIVVRTGENMAVSPTTCPVETFVIAWRWGAYLGHAALAEGVDVCVSSWRRPAPNTMPALAKAGGNYLNAQLAKMEAQGDGYAEGIMLDSFGFVSEGSGENLFMVRDGVLYTTPLQAGILQGITRDSIVRLAGDLGIEVREMTIPREMLYVADELFFTGTAAELTPIRSVDRIQVGAGRPGPVAMALQREFMGIATGQIPDRHGWLTRVPRRRGDGRAPAEVVQGEPAVVGASSPE